MIYDYNLSFIFTSFPCDKFMWSLHPKVLTDVSGTNDSARKLKFISDLTIQEITL